MPTVLIAEDEPAVRDIMRMIVSRLGHDVVTAVDGEEALLLARVRAPDLVITDLMMPRRTGLELLDELARDPRLARIPAILVSATADPGAAVFRFLAKPFRLLDFEDAVIEALAEAARTDGIAA